MLDRYIGLVPLGNALKASMVTRNASDTPIDADATPTYRVYGPSGLMTNGTGSLALKDTGAVTGATNATPIVITSTGHGLTNGTRVTLANVGGNTAANATFLVANKTSNTFELQSSVGNGAYTSGGTWHVSGLYEISFTPAGGDGYAAGINYTILVNFAISSTSKAEAYGFTIV